MVILVELEALVVVKEMPVIGGPITKPATIGTEEELQEPLDGEVSISSGKSWPE